MPAPYLSPICSSFAAGITTIKFTLPTWRLYYEYTRNPKSIKPNLWLDTCMSVIIVILSWLLFVFSFVRPEERGLQVLLLLTEGLLIVYQGGHLSFYCALSSRWLRWAPATCFIATAEIFMTASSVGCATEAFKIMLLLFFLVQYLVICIVYSITLLLGRFYPVVHSLLLWNIWLSGVAWAGALAALVSYLKGQVDFITSLWIDYAAAMPWVVWLVWKQWKALQRARSPKEGLDEEDSNSQGLDGLSGEGSQAELMTPSAVHVR